MPPPSYKERARLIVLLPLLAAVLASPARALVVTSSATFDGPSNGIDSGQGIAAAPDGSLYVVGKMSTATQGFDAWVGHYSSAFVLLSSASFNGSAGGDDSANAVAVDTAGSVYVAGSLKESAGQDNLWIAKLSPSLAVIASSTYDGSSHGPDKIFGVAVDSSGVYATGFVQEAVTDVNLWVGRFDPNLVLLSSASFDDPANLDDIGFAVGPRGGRVFVAGKQGVLASSNGRAWLLVLDGALSLVSSATFSSAGGVWDQWNALSFDASANVLVGGLTNGTPFGGTGDVNVVRYSPGLVVQSTFTTTVLNPSVINGLALDASGDVLAVGQRIDAVGGLNAWIAELSPALTVISSVSFNGTASGSDQANAAAVFGADLFVAGKTNDAVGGDNIWLGRVPLSSSLALSAGQGGVLTLAAPAGPVSLTVPPGAFSQGVTVNLEYLTSFASPSSVAASLRGLPPGFRVTVSPAVQPALPVQLSLAYRSSDASGVDPSSLLLARFDARGTWVPLRTTVDGSARVARASSDHLSDFELMQSVPASSAAAPIVFPNPFRPNRGQSKVTVANLPAGARVRVYTLVGELLRDLDADGAGLAVWDGRNTGGQAVTSGVYLLFIQADGMKRIEKLAVER